MCQDVIQHLASYSAVLVVVLYVLFQKALLYSYDSCLLMIELYFHSFCGDSGWSADTECHSWEVIQADM